jgi:hypothetical protein
MIEILGNFKTLDLGVVGKMTSWLIKKNTIRGKAMASPKYGP